MVIFMSKERKKIMMKAFAIYFIIAFLLFLPVLKFFILSVNELLGNDTLLSHLVKGIGLCKEDWKYSYDDIDSLCFKSIFYIPLHLEFTYMISDVIACKKEKKTVNTLCIVYFIALVIMAVLCYNISAAFWHSVDIYDLGQKSNIIFEILHDKIYYSNS
jgi:hypothetical protein